MRPALAAVLCAAVVLPGCAKGGDAGGRIEVVTAVHPLTYVAQRVGGDRVSVTDVAPPGAEPHDVELTPTQVGQVEQADVVLLLGGFQPALDAAAPDDRTLDVAVGGPDPHVWLDPVALRGIAEQLARRLGDADAEHRAEYEANARALGDELDTLHRQTDEALRACERRDLVTSHAAFGHFAARYRLRETGIAGVDAEAEPSPRRLAEVAAFVKANGVTTVFAESAESRPARTVAREAGVRVAVLDPLEVDRGEDYFTVMRRNVAAIRTAMDCR